MGHRRLFFSLCNLCDARPQPHSRHVTSKERNKTERNALSKQKRRTHLPLKKKKEHLCTAKAAFRAVLSLRCERCLTRLFSVSTIAKDHMVSNGFVLARANAGEQECRYREIQQISCIRNRGSVFFFLCVCVFVFFLALKTLCFSSSSSSSSHLIRLFIFLFSCDFVACTAVVSRQHCGSAASI